MLGIVASAGCQPVVTQATRSERVLVSAAVLTSFFGEFVKFVLAIWVYTATRSVTAFAILSLIGFLPNLLLAPSIGIWLDRASKIRALRRAAITLALVALAGAAGIAFGVPSVALALMVIFAISIADAIEAPAYGVAAALLIPKARLQNFNGITESARSFSIMIAPVLASILIAVIDPEQIMIGAATIAVAAWLILLAIPADDPGSRESLQSSLSLGESVRDFRKTLSLMLNEPSMARLLAISVILNGLMAAFIVLFYPMMLQQFTEREVALLRSSFALGMVAGGLFAQLPIMKAAGIRLVVLGSTVAPLMMAIIALGSSLNVTIFLQAGTGAALTCMQARAQTLWQQLTPEEILGRVFSARRMIAMGIVPAMYAVTPFLVTLSIAAFAASPMLRSMIHGSAAGERLTVAGCSLFCLAALFWLAHSMRSQRAIEGGDLP